jgi:hypothetical protein
MPTQPKKTATGPTKAARQRREAELRAFFESLSSEDLITASNLAWELSLRADKGEGDEVGAAEEATSRKKRTSGKRRGDSGGAASAKASKAKT